MEDLVRCTVCLDIMINPHALKCLHSYCETCIQRLRNRGGNLAHHISCPVCSEVSGAHDIRKDFRTEQLIVVYTGGQTMKGSCDLCKCLGITAKCEDCIEYLCGKCEVSHKGSKASREHRITPSSEIIKNLHEKINKKMDCLKNEVDKLEKGQNAAVEAMDRIKEEQTALINRHIDTAITQLQHKVTSYGDNLKHQVEIENQQLFNSIKLSQEVVTEHKCQISSCMKQLKEFPWGLDVQQVEQVLCSIDSLQQPDSAVITLDQHKARLEQHKTMFIQSVTSYKQLEVKMKETTTSLQQDTNSLQQPATCLQQTTASLQQPTTSFQKPSTNLEQLTTSLQKSQIRSQQQKTSLQQSGTNNLKKSTTGLQQSEKQNQARVPQANSRRNHQQSNIGECSKSPNASPQRDRSPLRSGE